MTRHTKIDLEAEVHELRKRVDKLESMLADAFAKGAQTATAARKPKVDEAITPEIVLAITAAIAAFLGKRATIHQIRLTGTTAWAMQGRATVQASHGLVRWSR